MSSPEDRLSHDAHDVNELGLDRGEEEFVPLPALILGLLGRIDVREPAVEHGIHDPAARKRLPLEHKRAEAIQEGVQIASDLTYFLDKLLWQGQPLIERHDRPH